MSELDVTDTGHTSAHDAAIVPGRNGGKLTPIRDAARAREMVALREAKKARRIRDGVANAGKQVDSIGKADAYAVLELIAENNALNALDPSAPGAQRSAEWIVKHGWPSPEKGTATSDSATAGAFGEGLGVGVVRELLAEVRALRQLRGDSE